MNVWKSVDSEDASPSSWYTNVASVFKTFYVDQIQDGFDEMHELTKSFEIQFSFLIQNATNIYDEKFLDLFNKFDVNNQLLILIIILRT